jgi:hypothetical protein
MKDTQTKAYQEIELTAAELGLIEEYRNAFGGDWVERQIDFSKGWKYIRTNLEQISITSKKPRNCYIVVDRIYERKDGEPITEADLEALRRCDHGQIHEITVIDAGMKAHVHSECDSGD